MYHPQTISQYKNKISTSTQNQSHHQSNSQQQQMINDKKQIQRRQDIRESVNIPRNQMIRLINSNKLTSRISFLNKQAKRLIQCNQIQQSLIYLQQAQQILQYAASSGKNIQRKLIITILHNQACCYQIKWNLPKCNNYIEALIYNYSSQLKLSEQNNDTSTFTIQINKQQNYKYFTIPKQINKINKKIQLTKYYLLHCAINSQLKNHTVSLISAKKASQIIIKIFHQYHTLYSKNGNNKSESIQLGQKQQIIQIIQQVSKLSSSIYSDNLNDYIRLTRYYIRLFQSKCTFNNLRLKLNNNINSNINSNNNNNNNNNNNRQKYKQQTSIKFKQFLIGDIMELQPKQIDINIQNNQNDENNYENQLNSPHNSLKQVNQMEKLKLVRYSSIIQNLLILSISQFTIATQLRYIQKCSLSQLPLKISYSKQSQIYHLLSILIICIYIPFDIKLIEHLIYAYNKYYDTQLNTELQYEMMRKPNNSNTRPNNTNHNIKQNTNSNTNHNINYNNINFIEQNVQNEINIIKCKLLFRNYPQFNQNKQPQHQPTQNKTKNIQNQTSPKSYNSYFIENAIIQSVTPKIQYINPIIPDNPINHQYHQNRHQLNKYHQTNNKNIHDNHNNLYDKSNTKDYSNNNQHIQILHNTHEYQKYQNYHIFDQYYYVKKHTQNQSKLNIQSTKQLKKQFKFKIKSKNKINSKSKSKNNSREISRKNSLNNSKNKIKVNKNQKKSKKKSNKIIKININKQSNLNKPPNSYSHHIQSQSKSIKKSSSKNSLFIKIDTSNQKQKRLRHTKQQQQTNKHTKISQKQDQVNDQYFPIKKQAALIQKSKKNSPSKNKQKRLIQKSLAKQINLRQKQQKNPQQIKSISNTSTPVTNKRTNKQTKNKLNCNNSKGIENYYI